MHRCFTLVVPSLILLFSPALVQGQGERGEALPRGVSEIERDVSLGASSGIQLTTLPEWAQQGRFTFMRVDGGIMEREKARRSTYGRSFTPEESQILGGLYTAHADRIVKLMKDGGVNWVWIVWSNGWSLEYESKQWPILRKLIARLHAEGIKVTAYLCATSMFWQNMFMDEPRSITWVAFLPSTVRTIPFGAPVYRPPYPFTPDWSPASYGRRSGYRYSADLGNPEWRDYVKSRVGAAIDAGADAIFFDNPLVAHPKMEESTGFFAEIQRFIKEVKKSPALLSTHIGNWTPATVPVNDLCEAIYSGGSEPGIIDGKWRTNVPTWRFQRSFAGDKPMYGEFVANFPPSGTTGVPDAKAEKIAIAEGGAAQFGVANRVFGPFLKGIVKNEPKAMDTWAAIGQYNKFILSHPELYVGAFIVPDVVVLASDEWPFTEEGGVGSLLELLTKSNVQYEVRLPARLSAASLNGRRVVLVAGIDKLSAGHLSLLESYKRSGGKVYSFSGAELAASSEVWSKLDPLLGSRGVRLTTPGHVLATMTRIGNSERFVAHVINHDVEPQTNVGVTLGLSLAADKVRVYSPDAGGNQVANVRVNGNNVSLTVPKLDTYLLVEIIAR